VNKMVELTAEEKLKKMKPLVTLLLIIVVVLAVVVGTNMYRSSKVFASGYNACADKCNEQIDKLKLACQGIELIQQPEGELMLPLPGNNDTGIQIELQ